MLRSIFTGSVMILPVVIFQTYICSEMSYTHDINNLHFHSHIMILVATEFSFFTLALNKNCQGHIGGNGQLSAFDTSVLCFTHDTCQHLLDDTCVEIIFLLILFGVSVEAGRRTTKGILWDEM